VSSEFFNLHNTASQEFLIQSKSNSLNPPQILWGVGRATQGRRGNSQQSRSEAGSRAVPSQQEAVARHEGVPVVNRSGFTSLLNGSIVNATAAARPAAV